MRLRKKALADFRIRIRGMRSRGLTLQQIALATRKTHTTIMYHLDDDFAMLKRAKMRHRAEVRKRIMTQQTERADDAG